MPKRTIKINLKLPSGVTATRELTDRATQAAKAAVDSAVGELAEAQKLAKELADKGIKISAEELMSRKKGRSRMARKSPASAKKSTAAARKRVVLTDAQRKALAADLKEGIKIKEAQKKYGVSSATVMNVKSEAGLTQPRKS